MRNLELGFSKGIAILLVIVGHVIQASVIDYGYNPVFVSIYSFHMPLFFILSGWAFWFSVSSKGADAALSISPKVKNILWPYFFWSLILVLVKSDEVSASHILLSVLLQPSHGFWFFDALFFVYLCCFSLFFIVDGRIRYIYPLLVFFVLDVLFYLYLSGELRSYRVLYYSPFFFTGYFIGKFFYSGFIIPRFFESRYAFLIMSAVLVVLISGWGYGSSAHYVDGFVSPGVLREAAQYVFRYSIVLAAFFMIHQIYIISPDWMLRNIVFVGGITLEIYVLHVFMLMAVSDYVSEPIVLFAVVAVATIGSIMLFRYLSAHYLPFQRAYLLLFGGRFLKRP